MPLGLYTSCSVSAPCGLCSTEGIIGLLDVPAHFLDPERMKAALIWFERGYVEYKFPNNAKILDSEVERLEIAVELSSEVPGTASDWPSDITVWVNDVRIGTWTSPGDFGDKRGALTPHWWKLEGSQYGKLKTWSVSQRGTYVDAPVCRGSRSRISAWPSTTRSASGSAWRRTRAIRAASTSSAAASAITIRTSSSGCT